MFVLLSESTPTHSLKVAKKVKASTKFWRMIAKYNTFCSFGVASVYKIAVKFLMQGPVGGARNCSYVQFRTSLVIKIFR